MSTDKDLDLFNGNIDIGLFSDLKVMQTIRASLANQQLVAADTPPWAIACCLDKLQLSQDKHIEFRFEGKHLPAQFRGPAYPSV